MRQDPIFVAGLERTGTSLMYALLASHPAISMTRRTNFWRYFADQYGDLADDGNLDACLAKLRVYKRMQAIDVDFDDVRERFVAGPRTYAHLYAAIVEQVAERRGKPRWGDKSLNTERWADRILASYPDAVILHMVRDPRDRLASVVTRWKNRRAALGVGVASWNRSAALAARNVERHGDHYRIVRYEDLVTDPERMMQDVCRWIGEPYDEVMLSLSGDEDFRDRGANSSYGARQGGVISADSIGRFRSVLTPRQTAFVDRAARRGMAELGYDASDHARLSTTDRAASMLLDEPIGRAAMAAWTVRTSWQDRRGRPLPDYRIVESVR